MAPLTAVTAQPTGAHWHVEISGVEAIVTRTLSMAETMASRRVGGPVDVQVAIGGLEDLCADAVELGEQADAGSSMRCGLRRTTARALHAAGIGNADAGYLMGLDRGIVTARQPRFSYWTTIQSFAL